MPRLLRILLPLVSVALVLVLSSDAFAVENLLDKVQQMYQAKASSWGDKILPYARNLFMVLAGISIVVTFFPKLFGSASLGEVLGELIRYILFIGFFLWLLTNGPDFANKIIAGMQTIGEQASGLSSSEARSTSNIVQMGFNIYEQADKAADALDWDEIAEALMIRLIAVAVCLMFCLIAVNVTIQYCALWILAYSGVIFLGFGSTRWTSDMAVNYFKTVLATGTQFMVMILLIGIGKDIVTEATGSFSDPGKGPTTDELLMLLVFAVSLLMLVVKVPAQVAGIITGGSVSGGGIGQFTAGAAFGAAMTAKSVATSAASTALGAGQLAKNLAVMAGQGATRGLVTGGGRGEAIGGVFGEGGRIAGGLTGGAVGGAVGAALGALKGTAKGLAGGASALGRQSGLGDMAQAVRGGTGAANGVNLSQEALTGMKQAFSEAMNQNQNGGAEPTQTVATPGGKAGGATPNAMAGTGTATMAAAPGKGGNTTGAASGANGSGTAVMTGGRTTSTTAGGTGSVQGTPGTQATASATAATGTAPKARVSGNGPAMQTQNPNGPVGSGQTRPTDAKSPTTNTADMRSDKSRKVSRLPDKH